MTRLIHLTDLHFGAERTELVAPLLAALQHCDADLLVVSGDLTHRAHPDQFRAAMSFLARLQKPVLTVPGNHDMPLWNFPLRLIDPFRRYRIGVDDPRPSPVRVGCFRIFLANTADPYRWRSGILRESDVLRIERELQQAARDVSDDSVLNVLVCHHPIEEPPGFDRGETRGALAGMSRLLNAGLDAVLTGHLHHWQIGLGITAERPRRLLQIQSGTALCGRVGEHSHGFSVLDLKDERLTVTPWVIHETAVEFRPAAPAAFRQEHRLWHRLSGTDRQNIGQVVSRIAAT